MSSDPPARFVRLEGGVVGDEQETGPLGRAEYAQVGPAEHQPGVVAVVEIGGQLSRPDQNAGPATYVVHQARRLTQSRDCGGRLPARLRIVGKVLEPGRQGLVRAERGGDQVGQLALRGVLER